MMRWIPEAVIRIAHDDQIREHGGSFGVLNENALLSTMDKPENLLLYGENVTIFDLAASYGYGFIKNHCFVDGNKRIALVAINIFLRINGFKLIASEVEAVSFMLDLASRIETQDQAMERLSLWIKENSETLESMS